MKFFPKRKSIRLKNYDYSSLGYYFITICIQERKCLFGEINQGKMVLNNVGKLAKQWWLKIPGRFKNIELDEFQIMPNHMHGIIVNNGSIHVLTRCGQTHGFAPTRQNQTVGADPCVRPSVNQPSPLGKIIQWFKTMTTNQYIRNVKNKKWKPFHQRLWQRNYYENIIRTEHDLNKIREYIKINPRIWFRDRNNPENI
jgi:putative transposase